MTTPSTLLFFLKGERPSAAVFLLTPSLPQPVKFPGGKLAWMCLQTVYFPVL